MSGGEPSCALEPMRAQELSAPKQLEQALLRVAHHPSLERTICSGTGPLLDLIDYGYDSNLHIFSHAFADDNSRLVTPLTGSEQ